MRRAAASLLAVAGGLCLQACATAADSLTADGRPIPGKRFPQVFQYEHVCELTSALDVGELEHLLDRYGRNGWRVAGFLTKGGDTYAFCLER